MKDVQELSFEELLTKGDIALASLKDVFEVYGLSMDDCLDSVQVETVREEGDQATVRVEYRILGVSDSAEVEMVRVGRRWIRQDAVDLGAAFGTR